MESATLAAFCERNGITPDRVPNRGYGAGPLSDSEVARYLFDRWIPGGGYHFQVGGMQRDHILEIWFEYAYNPELLEDNIEGVEQYELDLNDPDAIENLRQFFWDHAFNWPGLDLLRRLEREPGVPDFPHGVTRGAEIEDGQWRIRITGREVWSEEADEPTRSHHEASFDVSDPATWDKAKAWLTQVYSSFPT